MGTPERGDADQGSEIEVLQDWHMALGGVLLGVLPGER